MLLQRYAYMYDSCSASRLRRGILTGSNHSPPKPRFHDRVPRRPLFLCTCLDLAAPSTSVSLLSILHASPRRLINSPVRMILTVRVASPMDTMNGRPSVEHLVLVLVSAPQAPPGFQQPPLTRTMTSFIGGDGCQRSRRVLLLDTTRLGDTKT